MLLYPHPVHGNNFQCLKIWALGSKQIFLITVKKVLNPSLFFRSNWLVYQAKPFVCIFQNLSKKNAWIKISRNHRKMTSVRINFWIIMFAIGERYTFSHVKRYQPFNQWLNHWCGVDVGVGSRKKIEKIEKFKFESNNFWPRTRSLSWKDGNPGDGVGSRNRKN